MGWRKVCGTTRSGIWVLEGDARTRKFPVNLDYFRVKWSKKRDHTRPPGSRQGTTVCVHMRMDMEQQSDHKPMTPSWMGSEFVGQGRTILVALVCKREYANGGEPEPERRSRIMHPLAWR